LQQFRSTLLLVKLSLRSWVSDNVEFTCLASLRRLIDSNVPCTVELAPPVGKASAEEGPSSVQAQALQDTDYSEVGGDLEELTAVDIVYQAAIDALHSDKREKTSPLLVSATNNGSQERRENVLSEMSASASALKLQEAQLRAEWAVAVLSDGSVGGVSTSVRSLARSRGLSYFS